MAAEGGEAAKGEPAMAAEGGEGEGPKRRDFRITGDVLDKYGLTDDCKGCDGHKEGRRVPHDPDCRDRIQLCFETSEEDRRKIEIRNKRLNFEKEGGETGASKEAQSGSNDAVIESAPEGAGASKDAVVENAPAAEEESAPAARVVESAPAAEVVESAPAAQEVTLDAGKEASPEGACTACKTEKAIVWRRLKDTKARVCNRCYLEKCPRPALKSEDAITGHLEQVVAVKMEEPAKARLEVPPGTYGRDGKPCPHGFLFASSEDHVRIDQQAHQFMDWLTKEHGKGESTAKNYKGKVIKSFRNNDRAISSMATDRYRVVFQDQDDSVTTSALKQFALFYLTQAKPEPMIKAEVRAVSPLMMKEEMKVKTKQEDSPSLKRKLEEEIVASDTEYPEVNLTTFPAKIRIQASGLDKIDGTYARMPQAQRGRPAYAMEDGKKEMYMYWRKKTWKIGLTLGSNKSLANVLDKEVCRHPCEPYPHVWQVFLRPDFFEARGLRVVDVELESKTVAAEPLPKEPTMAGSVAESPHRTKRHKAEKDPEKAIAKAEKKASAKAEKKAKTAEDEAAKPESPGGGAQASPKAAPEAGSDSDSSSESDSESDSSSSESGASSGAPEAPKTSPVAPALPPAAAGYDAQKAKMFEGKIRGALKTCTPAEIEKRIGMLVVKSKMYMTASTMSSEQLADFRRKLTKEFVTDAAKKTPRAAASAEKMPSAPQGLPSGPQGLPSAPQGSGLPVTPPDNGPQPGQDLTTHRQGLQPGPSILKKRGQPRGVKRLWMADTLPNSFARQLFHQVPLVNYKGYLDTLWFQQPGAEVTCDNCDTGVPQSMGCLQGALGRSQFAQHIFLCTNCMMATE